MKYLLLVYADEPALEAVPHADRLAFDRDVRESGHCVASEALEPVATATTVRVRNGRTSMRDGPFAATKEQLAGFYMIEARDLNEAIQIASRIPPARVGSIEVRPADPGGGGASAGRARPCRGRPAGGWRGHGPPR